MKMLIWKEWRENYKWAVLGMGVVALAFYYSLVGGSFRFNSDKYLYVSSGHPLFRDSFVLITLFGFPSLGFILGLLQILPELRRDQWAALVHRPVSRAVIYHGKLVAGLVLYFLAAGLPLLSAFGYVATPGHFPYPFVPGMTCPGWVDLWCGALYYLAALFMGLYRGSWYGVRLTGLILAVSTSVIVQGEESSFTQGIQGVLVSALLLYVAGWGAILTNGTFARMPWLGRMALVLVLFYVTVFAGSFINPILVHFMPKTTRRYLTYSVLEGGRVLLRTDLYGDNFSRISYYDLAGKLVAEKHLATQLGESALWFDPLSNFVGEGHGTSRFFEFSRNYRNLEAYYLGKNDYGDENQWGYVPSRKLFFNYDKATSRLLQVIGENGVQPDTTTARPFHEMLERGHGSMPRVFLDGDTVYRVQTKEGILLPLYQAHSETIYGFNALDYHRNSDISTWTGIALKDRVIIVDSEGKLLATLPYHQNRALYGRISVAVSAALDWFFLKYGTSSGLPYKETKGLPEYVEEMDARGVVVQTTVLPPLPEEDKKEGWLDYLQNYLQSPAFYYGNLAYKFFGQAVSEKLVKEWKEELSAHVWVMRTAIKITLASAFFGLIALGLARRAYFSWKRSWQWAGVAFALGLPGLVAFLMVADWPVQIACPTCRRKRPLEFELCPHCHTGWPVRERHPTDIYEPKSDAGLLN